MGLDSLAKLPLLRSFLTRSPQMALEQIRRARVARNPHLTWQVLSDGSLVLEAPLAQQGKGFSAWLAQRMNMPATKKFELEPIGAFLWEMFDECTTVETMSRKLREKYKMNRLEADASLNAFLQMLVQRRLITVLMPTGGKK